MRINKAEFITSIGDIAQYKPSGIPEICFAGRSNAGKSSLINYITNNAGLARVGSQPGKTRLINLFLINDAFRLVDLPGYGYARASKAEIKAWGALIEQYLARTESLREVFHLVDVRHAPTADDIMLVDYMVHNDIPFCHIATKCDRVPKTKLKEHISLIAAGLRVPETSIIAVSAEKNIGGDKLLDRIESVLTR